MSWQYDEKLGEAKRVPYISKSAGAKAETAKHTPGPWKARDYKNDDGDIWIDCENFSGRRKTCIGGTLATAHNTGTGNYSMEANAKLIAAAPELLEALRNAMGILATIRNDGYAGIALPQLDWILDGDETGDSTAVIALEKATGE